VQIETFDRCVKIDYKFSTVCENNEKNVRSPRGDFFWLTLYFHPELQQNVRVHSEKLAKAQNKNKLTKDATQLHAQSTLTHKVDLTSYQSLNRVACKFSLGIGPLMASCV